MRTRQALPPNPVDRHFLMVLDQKAAIAGPQPSYVAKAFVYSYIGLPSFARACRPLQLLQGHRITCVARSAFKRSWPIGRWGVVVRSLLPSGTILNRQAYCPCH